MDIAQPIRHRKPTLIRLALLAASFALLALVALLGPAERVLGGNLRLVVVHGAWVWTGKVAFGLAALTGLTALLAPRRAAWPAASLALGRTGLFFWLTYLPMSLLMMQLNWGGLFLDEPRWRIPFAFGVAAVLLQAALALFNHSRLTAAGNLLFGAALWWRLGGTENVLHPNSPIFTSDAMSIQIFFILLLGISLAIAGQLAAWQFHRLTTRPAAKPSP